MKARRMVAISVESKQGKALRRAVLDFMADSKTPGLVTIRRGYEGGNLTVDIYPTEGTEFTADPGRDYSF